MNESSAPGTDEHLRNVRYAATRGGRLDLVDGLMPAHKTARRDTIDRASGSTAQAPRAGELDRRFVLADGRVVTYREFGAATGYPVLATHGTPGSRLKFAVGHSDAEQLGLRLISPDRWGYGSSDAHPQPALARYADDIAEFADGLRIDEFSLVGVSGGGPFAVAVAAAVPERVRSLALVAPVGPIAGALDVHELGVVHRLCFQWLPPSPWIVRPALGLYRVLLRRSPKTVVPLAAIVGPAADKAALRAPDVCHWMTEMLQAGFERGVTGTLIDMQIFSRPWELMFERITAPTRIWLGTEDRNVPQLAVHWLAKQLARVEVTELEGQGHFWIARHHREVLEWLAQAAW
jgi:pimeloyl-ACP methyl ester carboxylesterase